MTQSQINKYRKHYNDRPNVNRMAAAYSTYTQAGVSCYVGQESATFDVQFFVGSSVVKIPACV